MNYDDPAALAQQIADQERPLLLGLDVDGVLAPIVHHADHARLTAGVADSLAELAKHEQLHVAVVSGRSIDDLVRFDFDEDVTLIGSHGIETQGRPMEPLTVQEADRLARLTSLCDKAMQRAGTGAWVETKPASVVLHVRQAESVAGADALTWLRPLAESVDGTEIKAGSAVLELFARSGNKGRAIHDLRTEVNALTAVFVGDDITDEDAFAVLGPSDVSIKVGNAATIANNRLRDTDGVRDWLQELSVRFG